jgi:hypothetical protein
MRFSTPSFKRPENGATPSFAERGIYAASLSIQTCVLKRAETALHPNQGAAQNAAIAAN